MPRLRPHFGRFFWKLFFGNALLLAAVLLVSVWLLLAEFEGFYRRQLTEFLESQATTLRSVVGDRLTGDNTAELDELARQVGTSAAEGLRVTIVLANGVVVGDSEADVSRMESHADRTEILQALRTGIGHATRRSHTVSKELLYVAARVGPANAPLGTIRVAMAVQTIGERTESVRRLIWTIAGIVLAAAVALALGLARMWSRPLRQITLIARRLSRGDLSARARISGSDELAVLGQSLNQMGENLGRQLATIDRQRQTSDAMLRQLREGVIVADQDGRIVMLNPAAAELLGLKPSTSENNGPEYEGQSVEACIRHQAVQQMLLQATARPDPASGRRPHTEESRLDLEGAAGVVTVLARASDVLLPIVGESVHRQGESYPQSTARLLVLTDVTQFTKAVQMRADFVANASHELRTPLSAIRASVETLLGMDLAADAASAGRFLDMIDRHSGRLESMASDLLALSRVEEASEPFKPASVDVVVWSEELRAHWSTAIASKELTWQSKIDESLRFMHVNQHLLALVMDNLLDNAIKFTAGGGRILLSAREDESVVSIEVSDTGCGIPATEQDRVFERFYQVERSRTGSANPSDVRGTGLGLSIVRHAVAAMDGSVALESTVGEGTRVVIRLPMPSGDG